MESEKGIIRASEVKLPKFVEQAYDSIEGMKQFANMLLESKLVPDSYYEKTTDNKPDYTKGKILAVVIVLLQAQQLAVSPMTGLQHIVPVNGLLSIKGDLAKTMIFASGKLKKDSWVETVTGSIEEETMVVTITATREDNGITTSRSFSVDKAKRMGLWITSAMVNSTDGWKYKKSAWFKTPDRMLFYRCLGNLARDLFSDVLLNMYTTEEAVDIQNDITTTIETESGAKITIPDKEHAKGRSTKMTDRVVDKIPDNKFGEVYASNVALAKESMDKQIKENNLSFNPEVKNIAYKDGSVPKFENYSVTDVQPVTQTIMQPTVINESHPVEEKDESPFISSKGSVAYMDGKEILGIKEEKKEVETPQIPGQYTLEGMEKMDTKLLLAIINEDMDMMEVMETIPGKNTNKKLREIIFAHQNNGLAEYVAPYLKGEPIITGDGSGNQIEADVAPGEIPINKDFDKQAQIDAFLSKEPLKKEEPKVTEAAPVGNKYGLIIPEETPRDFAIVKALFNKLMGIDPQITTPRYSDLAIKLGMLTRYADKEQFLKLATLDEINLLLNSN